MTTDPLPAIRTRDELLAALDRPPGGEPHAGYMPPLALREGMLRLGVPSVDLAHFPVDPNAIKALAAEQARRYQVLPLLRTRTHLAMAMADPLAWQTLHELEFSTGMRIDPVLAEPEAIAQAVQSYYGSAADAERVTQLVARLGEESAEAFAASQAPVTESDNTLVRLVNKIIADAHEQRASDIHIESRPNNQSSRVRFRIDGELRPYIEVPPNFRAALVSRIKIMCGLDISEHRRPQDGKIRFEEFGPFELELRVVIMPTLRGLEDVVMRILEPPRALTIDQLGLSPRVRDELKRIAQRSYGLLFVCGPTGSGKTTTLHSLLGFINTPNRKIWTVEDPVEITQDGLCQVEVNARLGLTFPQVLRSFLRADPDVIMVGETRDPETAHTVVTASLTGHLVVSTMHTNSAAESVVRLLELGLDPFNFSDALLGIVGQRLVRTLCRCKSAHAASDEELAALAAEYCRDTAEAPADVIRRWRSRYGDPQGSMTLHAAQGCPACENTGYKGRMGVYELLVATPAIKAAIQQRRSSNDILQRAVSEGMVTFFQDAIGKVLEGHLDLQQVLVSCR
ncbi:GspE/PulE family protein [Ramlibacter rhizophilus]|uniref:Type II/IV secretion system protein n=1 Tax=Ramlibacter rhizophilus TaxID=1781167 RepID=A0A4Z0C2B3_9BURK|nr:GspE/PulE family protein [Ramlibacter rhizophilus]TFZ04359.1 type II/IV secretion system protein [Ramlibacter rhizophilus]